MWYNLSDEDIADITAMSDTMGRPLARLAERLRIAQADQATLEARLYREAVPAKDEEREVDDDALVSASDNGAYVMTWFWVDKSEIADLDEDDGSDC